VYEHQVPSAENLTDEPKRSMLENTVSLNAELHQVKNDAALEKTKTGKDHTYKEYLSQLRYSAAAYDNQFSINNVKHNVVSHKTIYSNNYSTKDDDLYDKSAPVSVISAHSTDHWTKSANKCGNGDVRMQHAKWFSLETKSREIWDQLDNRAKPIILGYKKNGSGSSSMSSKPGTKFGPFQKKSNLHEISAHEFVQTYSRELEDPEMYEQKDILKLSDKSEGDDDSPNSSDTQCVNTATLSNPIKLSPADLKQAVSDTFKSHVNKCVYYLPAHNQMSLTFPG
jgi:hypothetical protein